MLIYPAASDYSNGEACKNWPTAKGKLTTAEIKKTELRGETKLNANVQYEYLVNGRTFTADRVQFGGLMFRDPVKVLEELKSTKELNVHYKPDQPEVSCIEIGFNKSVILLQFIAAILMACLALVDHFKHRKATKTGQSMKTEWHGKKLSSMPGLKEQQEVGLSEASSQAILQKNNNKSLIFILVFLGVLMAASKVLDHVEIPGIPAKLVGIGVLFFGGLSIVMLVSSIAPCIAFLMRRRHLQLAEMLANFNAAIYSGFSSSFELALARGLQAEVAQERLHYDKALSLSKAALDVMAERRTVLNAATEQKTGVLETKAMDIAQKQFCSLEAVCNESLGCIYFEMGQYDAAMVHATTAIQMAEDLLKDPSSDNPGTRLALAGALTLKGRVENILGSFDNAKADLKRAMSIRQEVKLPCADRLAIVMANLASTYTMQRDYGAAERLIDDGLKILEGSNEVAMELAKATLQFYRAELKMHQRQYESAAEFLNKCIASRERLLLPNHPHIAEAYLVSFNLSQLMGKSSDADRQREKASAMLKFCFGDKHPLLPNSETFKSTTISLRQNSKTRA